MSDRKPVPLKEVPARTVFLVATKDGSASLLAVRNGGDLANRVLVRTLPSLAQMEVPSDPPVFPLDLAVLVADNERLRRENAQLQGVFGDFRADSDAAAKAYELGREDARREVLARWSARPVGALGLKGRTWKRLRAGGIHDVGSLLARTAKDLLGLWDFGPVSLADVRSCLSDRLLWLRGDEGLLVVDTRGPEEVVYAVAERFPPPGPVE